MVDDGFPVTTMSAKSLGRLAMIYAFEEIQNPLPVQQCCLKVLGIAMERDSVFQNI